MNPSISTNRVRDAVKTVNNIAPDVDGNVEIAPIDAVLTVNGVSPVAGNVDVTPASIGALESVSANNSITVTPVGQDVGLAVKISTNAGNAITLTGTGLYVPANSTLLKYHQTIVATAGVQYQIHHSFSTPHVFVQAYDWGSIIEGVLVQPSNVKIDVSNVFITFATSSTFIVNIIGFYP